MTLLDVSLLIGLYLAITIVKIPTAVMLMFLNTGAVLDPTGMIVSSIVFIPCFLSSIRKILKHTWLQGAFISRPLLLLVEVVPAVTSYLALNMLQVLYMV